jgi:NAD(P)-dependent dehydrogenase (short-subunit alcohol dehydrogenase family)
VTASARPAILITGATRGIGAATARLAATRGYRVVVNYGHDDAAAQMLVGELKAAGAEAFAIKADVSSERDIVSMFAEVDRLAGTIDALVNNVGVIDRQGRLEDLTEVRLNRMFATNVNSAFLCSREAVRRMSTARDGRGGAIVSVSSAASRLGSPNEYVHYAASKAAVDAMTIGLAKEVAEEGIRVNAVRAGVVYTGLHATGGEPARVERVKLAVPMRRGGQPEEVARAILWLLSDEASYVTGSLLDVSGGR